MMAGNSMGIGGSIASGSIAGEGAYATVKSDSLNSNVHGDKEVDSQDVHLVDKGDQLNVQPITNTFGFTAAEIGQGLLAGVGIFSAAGYVGNKVKGVAKGTNNLKKKMQGQVQGKDGKWYNSNKRSDVEEYLDQNKGAKSYLDQSKEPNHPQTTPTTNKNTTVPAATNTVNMESSLNKDIPNSTISDTEVKGKNINFENMDNPESAHFASSSKLKDVAPSMKNVGKAETLLDTVMSKGGKVLGIGGKALGIAGLGYMAYDATNAAIEGDEKGFLTALDPSPISTVMNKLDQIAVEGRNPIPNQGVQTYSNIDGSTSQIMSTTGGRTPGFNTLMAAQADTGMPQAIDAHNTQENATAIQSMARKPSGPAGSGIFTFQTRAGAMQVYQNSKTGNLDIHLPGAPFASGTNMPFTDFAQSVMDMPQTQYEMAQAFAQSNLDPSNSGKVLQADTFEAFKTELTAASSSQQMQSYRIANTTQQSVGMIEELTEVVTTDVTEQFESIEEMIESTSEKVDRLS